MLGAYRKTGDVLLKNNEGKNVTINDIAKACGVSKATISRYLNNKNDSFSEETRDKITKVIAELGYNPNRSAQRLKATSTKLIGCSIGDMSRPYAGLLLRGITSVFQNTGYQVLFTHCNNNPEIERNAIDGFLANRVDGLIVNTSGRNDDYLVSIVKKGIPLVLVDRGLLGDQKLDTVELNNEKVAYESIKILHNCGYEQVAFFTEKLGSIYTRIIRYKGFCKAVDDFYPGTEPVLKEIIDDTEENWISAIMDYYHSYPGKRVAILTSNGITTYKIVRALNKLGIEFGWKLGLFSFDDWELMQTIKPGITSISVPNEKIGAASANLLLKQIENHSRKDHKPVSIKLDGIITVRGSTIKG